MPQGTLAAVRAAQARDCRRHDRACARWRRRATGVSGGLDAAGVERDGGARRRRHSHRLARARRQPPAHARGDRRPQAGRALIRRRAGRRLPLARVRRLCTCCSARCARSACTSSGPPRTCATRRSPIPSPVRARCGSRRRRRRAPDRHGDPLGHADGPDAAAVAARHPRARGGGRGRRVGAPRSGSAAASSRTSGRPAAGDAELAVREVEHLHELARRDAGRRRGGNDRHRPHRDGDPRRRPHRARRRRARHRRSGRARALLTQAAAAPVLA